MIQIKNTSYIMDETSKIKSNTVITNVFNKKRGEIFKWDDPKITCQEKTYKDNCCCDLIKIISILYLL